MLICGISGVSHDDRVTAVSPVDRWARWHSTGRIDDVYRSGMLVCDPPSRVDFSPLSAGRFSVASNTSKTARASVRAGQAAGGALNVLGEFKYVIPLNGGKHAYVRNLTNGKTAHLRTDSEQFVEEIRVLATAGHAAKVRAELNALAESFPAHGWDLTEKRLVEAGVFEG